MCSSGTPAADISEAAECRNSFGDQCPSPAASVSLVRTRATLRGSNTVPTVVVNTSRSSSQLRAASRSFNCAARCRRSDSAAKSGRSMVRRDREVFSSSTRTARLPSTRTPWRTAIRPMSMSTPSHVSPAASPGRSPIASMTTNMASSRSPSIATSNVFASAAVNDRFGGARRAFGVRSARRQTLLVASPRLTA